MSEIIRCCQPGGSNFLLLHPSYCVSCKNIGRSCVPQFSICSNNCVIPGNSDAITEPITLRPIRGNNFLLLAPCCDVSCKDIGRSGGGQSICSAGIFLFRICSHDDMITGNGDAATKIITFFAIGSNDLLLLSPAFIASHKNIS